MHANSSPDAGERNQNKGSRLATRSWHVPLTRHAALFGCGTQKSLKIVNLNLVFQIILKLYFKSREMKHILFSNLLASFTLLNV